jgi:hypothetical protein
MAAESGSQALVLICIKAGVPDGAIMAGVLHPRRKVMEWFSQKTSIAGLQIFNWMIVLGAVIVALLIYTFMQDNAQTLG